MKQKNLITVVAAHQLTADTIAKAIGANNKCDGYYVGNGYAVTWTGGSWKSHGSLTLPGTGD